VRLSEPSAAQAPAEKPAEAVPTETTKPEEGKGKPNPLKRLSLKRRRKK